MFTAARVLLPVSLSVLVVIYKYFRSGQKSKFSEGAEVPLNPTSVPSPAPSDLEREILDWIRRLDPAVLNRIRNRDPALLHEIQQFDPAVEIRNFDPSIVDEIRNLDPAFPWEISESVDVPQNPPSVPSPEPSVVEILDWIGTLGPAVLDEIQQFDPAFLDEDRNFDPSIVDGIRKLSLKENEEKEEEEKERETEKEKENEKEREREKSESSSSSGSGGGNENGGEVGEEVVEESSRRDQYPLRLGDCWNYLRTGICKFGSNCKYNHPRIGKNKQVSKDKAKQREELEEKQDQTESKGEKDCSYYMRTGTCKYGTNCKFNHPDPTAAGESRPQSAYGNGRPASLQGLPNSQGINSETTEWNGYQAPAYLPSMPAPPTPPPLLPYVHRNMPAPPPPPYVHRNMPAPPPPPYVTNNSVTETNYYGQYAQQTQAEELPERPGQPVCFYFAQTGDCVNKSNCQYHHPKNQTAATPSCALSDRGLPLRPGQKICTEYSRLGVCSSGPTCRFDHPSLSDSFL
ncbi:zinc finger CCCH domain-containing protein 43-like isoform X2 [Malus domestica]|uniref:zinc finger CCCH domain-containing protein 43-like isoform X2 n=1 Tax=Malus domestica TaxID=3750 RepID=UPI003974E229